MKKTPIFIRVTAIFLITAMLSVGLLSCGENKATSDTNNTTTLSADANNNVSSENTAEENLEANLPDADFGGYKFRILNVPNESVTWLLTTITTEEETGESLNDAIYLRNIQIEDKYNFEIVPVYDSDTSGKASKSINSGADDYDLVMMGYGEAISLAQKGNLQKINDVPNMDLSKPYYDHSMIRDLSLNNQLYCVAGDLSFCHYSSTMVMFFNKKMLLDFGLDNPYELVKTNQWTYSKFAEMTKSVSVDLDGNGKFDEKDQYGYLSLNFLLYPSFMLSAGEKYINKDSEDCPYFAGGSEHFITVFSELLSIMHGDNRLFDADLAGNHRFQDVMFPGNQTLFWTELVNWAKILRDMESDFGILPHPKYNSEQNEFKSLSYSSHFMTIPTTATDISRTGHIIEALCSESRKSVLPVYYDTMLKTKISRDDESGEMLDIIFGNRTYELAQYLFSNEVYNPINTLAKQNNTDLASFVEKNSVKIERAIDKIMINLEKND